MRLKENHIMNVRLLVLCLFTTVISGSATSQDYNTDGYDKKLGVKFAPAGIGFGKLTFGGEYSLTPHSSVTLIAGVPFNKTQTVKYDNRDNDITMRSKSLMAGYRLYTGKQTMRGFYIEPYVKYLKHEGNGLIYTDLQGQEAIFDTKENYEGVGVGAQLGVQFLIAKLVILDFYFLGPEANSAKFNTVSRDITNNLGWDLADAAEAEKDIRDALEDIPVIGGKVGVKVDKDKKTVSTNYSGFMPGVRFGLSVGIRF